MKTIEQLKANLFELTYVMDRSKRKDLMDSLCIKVKESLRANELSFYVYNRMKLNKQVDYYTSNADKPIEDVSSQTFLTVFHQNSTMTILSDDHPFASTDDGTTLLLKLNKTEYFYSFVIVYIDDENTISNAVLNELRFVLEQFLTSLFYNRHEKYVYRRSQLMFELSSRLHSLHHTNEVLEQVYHSSKMMYPDYDFYFLMAHEVEYGPLPVKIIEYSKNTTLNPGIITLINNELQFEYDDEKKQTYIYSPMSGEQGVYGVFQLIIPQIIEFVDSEISFLLEFTNMIGRAIERTTLYQSSHQQVTDLQIINVATQEFNVSLQLDDITKIVKKHIYNSSDAEEIGVFLFKDAQPDKTAKTLDGSTRYFYTDAGRRFSNRMREQIAKDPKPFLSGDYESEEVVPYKSLMVIPLKASEAVFGMIIITHQEPYYFSFDKFKFIQSLVQHASLAFTNSILTERLKYIAITDHLTKLYARNHIDELISEQMQTSNRGALILFDIDDFKQINDTYGHYVGDQVLIQVANIIQSEMKDGQIAARWGGEEFAIYLPGATLEESSLKANIIREKVVNQTNPKVSLSSGVSIWEKPKNNSTDELFIRADKALYEAKASGKNKVVQNMEQV